MATRYSMELKTGCGILITKCFAITYVVSWVVDG